MKVYEIANQQFGLIVASVWCWFRVGVKCVFHATWLCWEFGCWGFAPMVYYIFIASVGREATNQERLANESRCQIERTAYM